MNQKNVKKNFVLFTEHNDFTYSSSLENFKESHYYTGFIDDVEFRLNDPYFAREHRERILREQSQNQPFNFTTRRRQNNRNTLLSTVYRYSEDLQHFPYYDEEEDNDSNSNSNATTTNSSNEENSTNDNMVGLYNELNASETDTLESTYEEEDQFDDNNTISTVDLSETNNATESVDENKTNNEIEEGEITEEVDTPPSNIQELQNLSTQVRDLLNDDDILVIDGRQRLLSLLSQIDNLHPA